MSKLIDTHFHLDYYKDHKMLYEQINLLQQYTLCMTASPGVYVSCKKLYPETKYLKFALGFHPQAEELSMQDFTNFKKLFHTANYIGEVGLDFSSKYRHYKTKQLDYFEQIVHHCADSNKLFSAHLKQSEYEAIAIIKKKRPKKCIIHWFTGAPAQLEELINLGCYFSINANMVKSEQLVQKVFLIPRKKLLIESDGPFIRINKLRYHPKMLQDNYRLIANALNYPKLRDEVYINFKTLLMM